jgi:hypothetical protein
MFLVGRVIAQPPAMADRMQRNMLRVGEQIPDVQGLTETGRTINLRELKGDYAVLVFGCLT